ncbi:putative alpha/beta superfamily hydrolase [Flavobacterium nitrogenifigens]|uniref:Alpha/beta superfamily hydrolase n=2 Tax=Flavobacterium TaxID=237 RepID=A0ABR6Q7P3_9FLAO|nr:MULTISPECIES: alpha/beta hydrolase-fold protein [Flavobacterium]MBB4801018.1 putative alpha/beta superfamily hydrolase [Flavobacterium nitrogenifigens]MBB6385234.1 putative alpha/beta superfamily hydrolase [Flavobacterium notoginsengisoli]
MKKVYLLILFISFSSFAQKTFDNIKSEKLGEERRITIGLPASYEANKDKKYPVLYLLDGDYLFDPFSGAVSYGNYWDDIPEMIIIGIHQNKDGERFDDTTIDQNTGLPFEKGANFFEFIGAELIPYIEKKYRTSPFRIIAGHDLTAGFANFYLYKEKSIFNAYICLSPELANKMEVRIPEKFAKIKEPIFFYLSAADGDIKKIKEPIDKLNSNIKIANNPLVNYKYEVFKGTTHYTEVLHSIPSALYQIFEVYRPINSAEYNDKIAVLQSGYAEYLENKYNTMSQVLGVQIPVRMSDFKVIENIILRNNAYSELGKMAEIGNVNYPKAMLGEYELGLMYEKQGDPKHASKKYQNASQMEPIGDLNKDMMYEKIDEMNTLAKKK